MSTLANNLEALSERANVAGRVELLEQFRADFALVWETEQARGDAGVPRTARYDEAFRLVIRPSAAEVREAGSVVKERMADAEWLRNTAADYARMADAIRRDTERSERIRAAVRAERRGEA